MATPNCDNLCTADKCAELEARIGALEQALELLEAAFEAHTTQDIPTAHPYTPSVSVFGAIVNGFLVIEVKVDESFDRHGIDLSEIIATPEDPEDPEVTVYAAIVNDYLVIEIKVGDSSDSHGVYLGDFKPIEPFVTFDIFPLSNNQYQFQVSVNGNSDSDTLTIENHVPSNLRIDGSFQSETLTISVADGESQDTAQINIPIDIPVVESTQHVESNLNISASYRDNILTISVADGESQDTAQVYIDADVINDFGGGGSVSCDGLSNELQDCCAQILAAINTNYNKIQEVETHVTIDISSTVNSDYKCEFPKDDDEELIPTYAEAKLVEQNFTGIGISGLNERLKYLAKNQDAIYQELCKTIPPPIDIPLNQALNTFCEANQLKTEDQFENEASFLKYIQEQIGSLFSNSIFSALVKRLSFIPGGGVGTAVVSTTLSWATGYLLEKSRAEQFRGLSTICKVVEEQPDVVSIVASPKVITNVEGKVLVLHFVTLDNYPKRSAGSYPRQIQIPGAKESYDWLENFDEVRWIQGNQYGELIFNEYKSTVSGWFSDESAANNYFDWVLTVTNGTQKDRNFPKRLNPRTDIVVQSTRIHRAFIESVNVQGQAICHAKYVPVIPESSNGN